LLIELKSTCLPLATLRRMAAKTDTDTGQSLPLRRRARTRTHTQHVESACKIDQHTPSLTLSAGNALLIVSPTFSRHSANVVMGTALSPPRLASSVESVIQKCDRTVPGDGETKRR